MISCSMKPAIVTTPAAEEWRPVKGYEGLYEVSNLGRIRSTPRYVQQKNKYGTLSTVFRDSKVLVQRIAQRGYYIISIRNGREDPHTYSVHRIVATAFIPNPLNLPQVNHKDENKLNNRVDNLEWCTAEYNMNYGTCKKRTASRHMKPVAQYDLEGNLVATYKGIKEAAKHAKVSWQMISACLTRPNIRTAGGYIYKYI